MNEMPRYLGRVSFDPAEGSAGEYRCRIAPRPSGSVRVVILFDGTRYPLERHYRYVHHESPSLPYTFPHMVFAENPPGLRVGPWPGWRGIPNFPEITVKTSGEVAPVVLQAWGDEWHSRHIRGVVWLHKALEGDVRCVVEDPRLVPVFADLYADVPLCLRPHPVVPRPELLSAHPRLLITGSDVDNLRRRVRTTHAGHWERIQELLHASPLPPAVTPESKTLPGPERLRPEDRALLTAIAVLVDPGEETRKAARQAYEEFIAETKDPGYVPLTIDTQSGETLFLLATCYDWLYDLWSEKERLSIEAWLTAVAGIVRSHLGAERTDFGQAHYLGCALGLLTFSLLFFENHPDAPAWAAECRGALDCVLQMLPEDGFFPHGINLWIYEYGFLLRWLEVLRVTTGEDLWDHPHWKGASTFRGAATSPDGLYGITFGDPQYRVGGDSWCHFLIAARTGSAEAQGVGDLLLHGPHAGVDFRNIPPRRRVYELLYHDPSRLSGRLMAGVRVFPDGGQVFCRGTGESPACATFRAGPPLGRQRYIAGEHGGYGHADPMNGSFLVYRGGECVVSGPGPTYRRATSLHNTITVNGEGQLGDTAVWLPDFFPPERLCPTPTVGMINGHPAMTVDLAAAYLPHLAVRRCVRTIYIDPDRVVLGVDEVDCAYVSAIAWHIHSWGEIRRSESVPVPAAFVIGGAAEESVLCLYAPEGPVWSSGWTEMVPAYPHDGRREMFLAAEVTGASVRFVWALVLRPADGFPRWVSEPGKQAFVFPEGTSLFYDHSHFTLEKA